MTTIHELLDEYAHIAPDQRTKGFYFERLIREFLATDPVYAAQYDEVWLWQEWPGRGGKVDTGIDLVARERYSGELCAIQCKFFAPEHYLSKEDIDSFFTASGKHPFTSRVIVSTTNKWSKHATDALLDQQIPTTRIGINELEDSGIDWSKYRFTDPSTLEPAEPKKLRTHQIEALGDVMRGFDEHDRGKLIMACGTGKTFTSLRIAERQVQPGGSVLFLVPSIALLSQSLREWAAESDRPMRAFAICSDNKVGRNSEDFTLTDLAFPATTNAPSLIAEVQKGSNSEGLTVFFSTYQSIDVISAAQDAGLAEFDLVICDEAHRTTGVFGKDESHFVRVHDNTKIRARKRLYMTATPKIFGESVKSKAKDAAVELASMDDTAVFGPEFHRLGFGAAVERDLLTDYRVLVLAVSQDAVSAEFQQQFADDNNELTLDDAARIAGIYKAFSKSGVEGLAEDDRAPMRRAVAFSRSIKDSQRVTAMLNDNASLPESLQRGDNPLVMQAEHVDGTMNVMQRTALLDWLKDDAPGNTTRILNNARCLSEGVDVPSLDAVIFLNSRDSQVDVVQSVGRVMRKLAGKHYGYIILPIAVPAGVEADVALDDHKKYKVVWEVLRALRAHDERFEAKINQFELNRATKDDQVQVIGMRSFEPSDGVTDADGTVTQVALDFTPLGEEWRTAVYAKIVQRVGEREYWENWASSVADVAAAQTLRIQGLLESNPAVRGEFDRFVKGLQDNLNSSVTEHDALEMLSQHLITEPVLDALFDGFSFTKHNPVAKAMQGMLDALHGANLDTELAGLDGFYESVRMRVRGIKDASGKQDFLKLLYQRFFSVAMKKASERLGIVYTPTEIVNFILRSVDDILREQFDSSLGAAGVHVLDPFVGTGTFIAQLIHSDLISDAQLPHKFREELHANEINLLAYYVAAVNIEEAYHSRMGGNYVPFDGVLLTDTFQNFEADDTIDEEGVFVENNAGVIKQKSLTITVIVGNPPYSVGQSSGNDDNQNLSYPTLDARIKNTYAAQSSAQNKNNLYDSYIRAIRWASDRIGDRGVVGFVTNGGFLDGNTADGVRKVLAEEFSELYMFNLRGNARTAGEQRRKERDSVFGQGTRTTIVIALLVKNPDATEAGALHYRDVGDYLTREQKLTAVKKFGTVDEVPWDNLVPNEDGDWINQRNDEFEAFTLLSDKRTSTAGAARVLTTYSLGLQSGRDAWVFNSSRETILQSARRTAATFNESLGNPFSDVTKDASRISWTSSLISKLPTGSPLSISDDRVVDAMYRPFFRQKLYLDKALIHRPGQMAQLFPDVNLGIFANGVHSQSVAAFLMVDVIPSLDMYGKGGQFFPRYSYEKHVADDNQLMGLDGDNTDEYTRVDNVTDGILADYRATYGAEVTKDDIFFYVYGLLHSPEYRERFASDLKKMLPRIPKVKDFWAFAKAGRELSELHLGYEQIEPWALEEVVDGEVSIRPRAAYSTHSEGDELFHVVKMHYGGKRPKLDKSRVVVNEHLELRGIPDEAHEYMLGSRSALDWILERYQIKKDKPSGIVNDPNDWGKEHGDPRYIVDLVKRITRVSVETVRIVKSLPPLDILDTASPMTTASTKPGGSGVHFS
ncbi:DEAD/DEAH box helicase [Parafrigoribacterium humi]|uniref:DEAD/DEAH box helicase n=1 Tax=Parafrigoribacterium humi TaxID=3144664 RepID=UPI0032ED99DE